MRTYRLVGLLTLLIATAPIVAAPVPAKMPEPLRGTVTAADGSPAAGAVVWAAKHTYGPLVHRETVADEQGRFSLPLDPGEWYVWARKGTQGAEAPARHEGVTISADRPPEPLAVRLEERGTFRGRLLEAESRKPIAGGRLFLDAGVALTTDAEGRFEIGGLFRSNHEAFVVAPGRMRMRVLFDTTARADTELDVPVPVTGKIVGRVTDLDGKPIAGAQVGRSTSGSFFSINGLYTACDAEGRFEYDDAVPPDQPTRLTASAPGYVAEERSGLSPSPDGNPLELTFRLRPKPDGQAGSGDEKQRVVSGIIRGPTGKPAAGVVVRWGHEAYVGATQTKTDAEGRFSVSVPDQARILAILPRDASPEFLQIAAGGDQKVEVSLASGHVARGGVRDDAGRPIEGVRVIAVIPSPEPRFANPYWLSESAVRTDGEGKFELKGVPTGARFDFLKSGLNGVRGQDLKLDDADNVVTMTHGGAVSGRVVDRDSKPIRNFRVLVGFPRQRQANEQTEGFFAGYSGIGVRFTSDDGTFVLTGVGAKSVYRITVIAEGHGEAFADRVAAAVPTNRLKETEPVTLKAGPPTALKVRAVTADGKPVAGARVTLVNGEPGLDQSFAWGYHNASWEDMARGRTDKDGWANFPSLGFGGATVLVQAEGYGRQRVGWRNEEKELKVEMVPEGILTGEVRDAAGAPVKDFYVNLMKGGDQIAATVGPDDKGRFRITELPPGTWSVTIRGSDGATTLHQGQVTLKAGETQELKIEAKKP